MNTFLSSLLSIFLGFCYLAGIVLAKGVWLTFFAIIFPPCSFYFVVERILLKFL